MNIDCRHNGTLMEKELKFNDKEFLFYLKNMTEMIVLIEKGCYKRQQTYYVF